MMRPGFFAVVGPELASILLDLLTLAVITSMSKMAILAPIELIFKPKKSEN